MPIIKSQIIGMHPVNIPAMAILFPANFSLLIFLREIIPNIIARIPNSIPNPNIQIRGIDTIPRINDVIAEFDVSTILINYISISI